MEEKERVSIHWVLSRTGQGRSLAARALFLGADARGCMGPPGVPPAAERERPLAETHRGEGSAEAGVGLSLPARLEGEVRPPAGRAVARGGSVHRPAKRRLSLPSPSAPALLPPVPTQSPNDKRLQLLKFIPFTRPPTASDRN